MYHGLLGLVLTCSASVPAAGPMPVPLLARLELEALGQRSVQPQLLFAADDGKNGSELWMTNGTEPGTTMVKDINPGKKGSGPASLTVMDTGGASGWLVFFSADDGKNGRELWVSNGSAEGTTLVKDINPGKKDSNPANLTVLYTGGASGPLLFFTADDGKNGTELWVSNGTEPGTTMVKDINPGKKGSNPANLTVYNGLLYFTADDGKNGTELWVSNGTEPGTTMVKDINPGKKSSNPTSLTVFDAGGASGPLLFFSADDGKNGAELWSSNGTSDGTTLVKDINPGKKGSNPANLTVFSAGGASGPLLFFTADDGKNGVELWSSNGTSPGTEMVKDINPGAKGSEPANLTVFDVGGASGPLLFFTATDGKTGTELWASNGTGAGTFLVKDVNPGAKSSNPANLTVFGNLLFFSASNGRDGIELWYSNGTSDGTTMVKDINPGKKSSSPDNLFVFNVRGASGPLLFFAADDGKNGFELWASNGSPDGTLMIKDINPGAKDSNPSWFVVLP